MPRFVVFVEYTLEADNTDVAQLNVFKREKPFIATVFRKVVEVVEHGKVVKVDHTTHDCSSGNIYTDEKDNRICVVCKRNFGPWATLVEKSENRR